MNKWNPSKADVKILCESILSHWYREDHQSSDYCIHCGRDYGNIDLYYFKEGKIPPHKKDCPYLIAQDIMTGIEQ